MFRLKAEVFPSFLIILLGSIDCVTTFIGVMYFGASELNPFMTGIVNSSMAGFLILKISATFLIGFTYVYAKRILNKAMDKSTKAFRVSCKVMKGAYAGIMIFLILTVINNLIVLTG
jgi:Domain of unknown function (DUF5658)